MRLGNFSCDYSRVISFASRSGLVARLILYVNNHNEILLCVAGYLWVVAVISQISEVIVVPTLVQCQVVLLMD